MFVIENIAFDDVDTFINDELEDEYTEETDKEFLKSLTSDDKIKIANCVINDSELSEILDKVIRYYVYHYNK